MVIFVVLPHGEFVQRSDIVTAVILRWWAVTHESIFSWCESGKLLCDVWFMWFWLLLTSRVDIDLYFWPLTYWPRVFWVFRVCGIFNPQHWPHAYRRKEDAPCERRSWPIYGKMWLNYFSRRLIHLIKGISSS